MIDLNLLTNVPSVPPDMLLFQMIHTYGQMVYKPSDIFTFFISDHPLAEYSTQAVIVPSP